MKYLILITSVFVFAGSTYASWGRSHCEYYTTPKVIDLTSGTCSTKICSGKVECLAGGKVYVNYDVSCSPDGGKCPSAEACINDKSISFSTVKKKKVQSHTAEEIPQTNSVQTE